MRASTPNLVMAILQFFNLEESVVHVLHREVTVSRSSFLALGSQIIALPFPAFSKYLHLRLGSDIGWLDSNAGRNRKDILGIGDSTTHLFLANPPVLIIVITVVHF